MVWVRARVRDRLRDGATDVEEVEPSLRLA